VRVVDSRVEMQHLWLWLLGNLLALVALALLGLVNFGGLTAAWVWLAFGVIAVATMRPAWVARLPLLWHRRLGAVLPVWFVGDFLLGGADFIPPLLRMVVTLIVYRSVIPRTVREDSQHLVLALFILLMGGVFSLSPLFAPAAVLFTGGGLWALFLTEAVRVGRAGVDGRWGAEPARVPGLRVWWVAAWRALDRAWLGLAVVMMVGCLLFAGALFLVLPRFQFGQALPFLAATTRTNLSGFSDRVEFGDFVDVLENPAIAFRVDTGGVPPVEAVYWRMAVLDEYTGRGFRVSPVTASQAVDLRLTRLRGVTAGDDLDPPTAVGTDPTTKLTSIWTVYYEGGISAWIPQPAAWTELRFNNRQSLKWHGVSRVLAMRETAAGSLFYRLSGVNAGVAAIADVRDWGAQPHLLDIPGGEPIANPLRAQLRDAGWDGSARTVPAAIGRLLQTGRGYSTRVNLASGGGGDPLIRWIEGGGDGYCEWYAGAAVLLARAAGIPARMVTGFLGGDWNGFENYLMVRQRHAHAWCELLVDGKWYRFDPTPGNNPIVAASGGQTPAGDGLAADQSWQAWMDSLRVVWFRRVVQFDRDQQQGMWELGRGQTRAVWEGLRDWEWRGAVRGVWTLPGTLWKKMQGSVPIMIALGTAVAVGVLLVTGNRLASKRGKQVGRGRIGGEARWRARARQRLAGGQPLDLQLRTTLQRIAYGPAENWPEHWPKL
jgi:protein-glutamine gamma-glutamyltransferase